MDVSQMLQEHITTNADLTIATIPVPIAESPHFGVVEIDPDYRVTGFVEKPKPEVAKSIPDRPDLVLASMGNYIFKASVMIDVLQRNALRDSAHDFGKEVIPDMYRRQKVHAYDFAKNYIPGEPEHNRGYWRDVGTIDAYFLANIDLTRVTPDLDIYDHSWPIWTHSEMTAPATAPPSMAQVTRSPADAVRIRSPTLASLLTIIRPE